MRSQGSHEGYPYGNGDVAMGMEGERALPSGVEILLTGILKYAIIGLIRLSSQVIDNRL